MGRKRFCVFCGSNPPRDKTNEHIIPEWLNSLSSTKEVNTGINFATGKQRVFSTKSFAFPACHECNLEYSELEGKVRAIMQKLVNYELDLKFSEIDFLMDWFDKIRIGLWLGYQYLDGSYLGTEPNFFIKNRIGRKDRILGIIPTDCRWTGYNYTEAQSPVFLVFPCALVFRVLNIFFITISYDFLVAENAGLLFPKVIEVERPGLCIYKGAYQNAPQNPLYDSPFVKKGLWFGQAIYPGKDLHPIWSEVPGDLYADYQIADHSGKLTPIYFDRNTQSWLTGTGVPFATAIEQIEPSQQALREYMRNLQIQILYEQLKAYRKYHRLSLFHTNNYWRTWRGTRRMIKLQKRFINTVRSAHNSA